MRNLTFALKQTTPLLISYIFVGLAFGILMVEAGYSFGWSIFAAAFIYAGSMQIVMVSLLTSGVSLFMMAILTFFINGRHIFYGIGFLERFRKMGAKYPYMALTLTDETYSVLCSVEYPNDVNPQKVDFYIASSCHFIWVISCTIGALLGDVLPFDLTGIEFTATAFFVTVCVNQWCQFPSHIPAFVGLVSGVGFYFLIGADNFILPALSVSLIVLIVLKDRVMLNMGGLS